MDQELFAFNRMKPDQNIIDEIFSFDVNALESTSSITLTKYITAAAQYLIYYKSQVNVTKAQLSDKQSDYEIGLSAAIATDPNLIKKHGTKTAAVAYLVTTDNKVIGPLNEHIKKLKQDLIKVEGMDRAITEYINAFKRELDRRKHEYDTARMERRI